MNVAGWCKKMKRTVKTEPQSLLVCEIIATGAYEKSDEMTDIKNIKLSLYRKLLTIKSILKFILQFYIGRVFGTRRRLNLMQQNALKLWQTY